LRKEKGCVAWKRKWETEGAFLFDCLFPYFSDFDCH
jgi:hypothetical protein